MFYFQKRKLDLKKKKKTGKKKRSFKPDECEQYDTDFNDELKLRQVF